MIAYDATTITPSDTVDTPADSVYIGGDGDLRVITRRGSTVTFKALTAGSFVPVQVRRVLATGTTASNLIGLV